jgi:predicted dehydrogenase
MHAMRLGKAVYVEKPLAHSFRECELLMQAEERCGVVCQMGNQGHSGDNFYQYRDYTERGIIKDVTKVVSHMNMQRRWHKWNGRVTGYPAAEKMPPTLDWETWRSFSRVRKRCRRAGISTFKKTGKVQLNTSKKE